MDLTTACDAAFKLAAAAFMALQVAQNIRFAKRIAEAEAHASNLGAQVRRMS